MLSQVVICRYLILHLFRLVSFVYGLVRLLFWYVSALVARMVKDGIRFFVSSLFIGCSLTLLLLSSSRVSHTFCPALLSIICFLCFLFTTC